MKNIFLIGFKIGKLDLNQAIKKIFLTIKSLQFHYSTYCQKRIKTQELQSFISSPWDYTIVSKKS